MDRLPPAESFQKITLKPTPAFYRLIIYYHRLKNVTETENSIKVSLVLRRVKQNALFDVF
jgi:hypothetical protein